MPSWVAPTRVRRGACAACPAAWPRPHEPETQTRPCHQTAFIEQLLRVLRRGASVCQLLVECGVDSTVAPPKTATTATQRESLRSRQCLGVGTILGPNVMRDGERLCRAKNCRLTPPTKENALPQFSGVKWSQIQILSARHCQPDATERPYFALMFRAGRRVHGRWQCPRCSTCLARGRRSTRRPPCES